MAAAVAQEAAADSTAMAEGPEEEAAAREAEKAEKMEEVASMDSRQC